MKVGIIGLGVVGSAVKFGLEKIGVTVIGVDKKDVNTKIEDVVGTQVVFICVPTNMLDNGKCDVSVVKEVLTELDLLGYKGIIAIKSTVIPGTTSLFQRLFDKLTIAFCPEFLRERCAITDFCENHDVLVVGSEDNKVAETIINVHGSLPKNVVIMKSIEAELVKYFHNVYNMMRIVFANEFYEVCSKVDANYTKIKNAVCLHRLSTNKYYLDCSENWRGAGGVCLPKDTKAFAKFVEELFNDSENFFEILFRKNTKFKTTVLEGMRLK